VEFGNNAPGLLPSRDQITLGDAGLAGSLLVSVLAMPFSTTAQRFSICNQLIWAYNPPCQTNASSNASSELARKLEALEKKHEEQSTHLQLLLANISKLFEPPPLPERPRRQVGFLPSPILGDA
jgi:hypothetical protein